MATYDVSTVEKLFNVTKRVISELLGAEDNWPPYFIERGDLVGRLAEIGWKGLSESCSQAIENDVIRFQILYPEHENRWRRFMGPNQLKGACEDFRNEAAESGLSVLAWGFPPDAYPRTTCLYGFEGRPDSRLLVFVGADRGDGEIRISLHFGPDAAEAGRRTMDEPGFWQGIPASSTVIRNHREWTMRGERSRHFRGFSKCVGQLSIVAELERANLQRIGLPLSSVYLAGYRSNYDPS
jgi:hypothetical protein